MDNLCVSGVLQILQWLEHLWKHVNMFKTGVQFELMNYSPRSEGILGISFRFFIFFYHEGILCVLIRIDPVWQHTFVSPSAFSRRAVVSYWRTYVHEVLVNRLGGLSLPRKSVVRLTDRPDMTLDVYRGRKTTMQQQQQIIRIAKD